MASFVVSMICSGKMNFSEDKLSASSLNRFPVTQRNPSERGKNQQRVGFGMSLSLNLRQGIQTKEMSRISCQ